MQQAKANKYPREGCKSLAIALVSASANRRSENVGIETVVISELKLRDVQRHIFGADFVECADHAALEDRPKAFNRVRVDRADHIAVRCMVHGLVLVFGEVVIDRVFIGRQQADLVRNHFAHERFSIDAGYVIEHAGDYVAFAAYCADDRSFARAGTPATAAALIEMFVLVLSADPSFVYLDNAAQLVGVFLYQRQTDFVCHEPRGFDRTEAHVAPELTRAHPLFAGQHQMGNFKPVAKRLVGVLKDRPCNHRKAIARRATRRALRALPMPLARRQVIDGGVATTRAVNALGPSAVRQVRLTGILVADRKHGVELRRCQLMDRLWNPFGDHRTISPSAGYHNGTKGGLCQVRVHRLREGTP
jgi:hypothetical protein